MSELLKWLPLVFGGKFVVEKTGSFGSGEQTDGLSCGLFAMNAIRHEVLKEPLLDQKGTRGERVRWFNALCQAAYEMVWRSHPVQRCDTLTRFADRRTLMILSYKSFRSATLDPTSHHTRILRTTIRHGNENGVEWISDCF